MKLTEKNYIVRTFNGHASEDTKFVEVEGKKYIDDGTGKPKVDEKGEKVLFVEKQIEDLSTVELEELATKNPHVKKMLEERKAREEADKNAEIERKKKEDEEAVKKGEFQKLADERQKELDKKTTELDNAGKMLANYKKTVENILNSILPTIPKDKLGLIPENFSARERLEYIIKNADVLGAKTPMNKGGEVKKNDDNPVLNDLEKMQSRFDELLKKGSAKTNIEYAEQAELATKIKKARTEKEQNK